MNEYIWQELIFLMNFVEDNVGGKIAEKEAEIARLLIDISVWYHKWEEVRDGQTVICIEYARVIDPEDKIVCEGEIS